MRIRYRLFRNLKSFIIVHRPWGLTWAFFSLLPHIERLFSARRESGDQVTQRRVTRQLYFTRYSRESPPFRVVTENPIAINSDDHLWPHGTLYDNSANNRFNLKLYDLVNRKPDLKVLDIGCSGGAFVRSILEDGYTAVGVEGSDTSLKLLDGEWGSIPLHLFTCDATKPFRVESNSGSPVQFDVITAWEVLEHIPKCVINQLTKNISDNLAPGGYFIASVPSFPDANPLVNAVYHVTLESKQWWVEKFAACGFSEVVTHRFQTRDWVRGNGVGLTNWSPEEGDGFHLVLRKSAAPRQPV